MDKSLVDAFVFQKAKKNTDLIKNQLVPNQYPTNSRPVTEESATSRLQVGCKLGTGRSKVGHKSDTTQPIADNYPTNTQPVTDPEPSTQPVADFEPTCNQHTNINISDPIWNITDIQSIILGHLVLNKSKLIQRKQLIHSTGVTEASVKKALRVLHLERFITKPVRWKNYGSVYDIHTDICNRFMELRWPKIINKYGNPPKIKNDQDKPSSNQPVTDVKPTSNQHEITDLEPTSLSSSRFLNKNTSTKEKIEQVLQDHPELGYWRQKNITPKQIQNWLKISQCTLEVMVLYLSYCAFDMVDNKKEKDIKKTVFDYFFRIIERAGHYPEPQNYKSHQQKKIEDMEKVISEKEAETKKLEELRQKTWKVEQDLEFQKMMSDPECDLYKECFKRLNKFAQQQLKGKNFERSMKGAYEKLIEEREEAEYQKTI